LRNLNNFNYIVKKLLYLVVFKAPIMLTSGFTINMNKLEGPITRPWRVILLAQYFSQGPANYWTGNPFFLEEDRAMTGAQKKFLILIGYYAVLITAMFMIMNQPIFS